MTVINKTNERDERKQIGNALGAVEADLTTAQGDITTAQGDITTLQGDLTTAQGNISSIDARVTALEGGVNGTPPISLKGIDTAITDLDVTEITSIVETTASETAYDTWKVILQETAAEGVLQFMPVYQVANASERDVQARLTIDGTVVWTSSTTFWTAAADNGFGVMLIGSALRPSTTIQAMSFEAVPFNTSFKLDFKKTENAAGTVEMGTRCKYYLTG